MSSDGETMLAARTEKEKSERTGRIMKRIETPRKGEMTEKPNVSAYQNYQKPAIFGAYPLHSVDLRLGL